MKLNQVEIERALETKIEQPRGGPIAAKLRECLLRFGLHGEYWIKEKAVAKMGVRRVRYYAPTGPIKPCFAIGYDVTAEDIYGHVVEKEIPAGFGYCSIGALMHQFEAIGAVSDDHLHLFLRANSFILPQYSSIPRWNDDAHTRWPHVKAAFERAIRMAEAENL